MMWPKEHGAWGQMVVPLVTALVAGDLRLPAALVAVAVVAAFVAHEPLLVLLGRRGSRAKREEGRRAAVWLAALIVLTIVAGAAAAVTMPDTRWTLWLPLAPALVLAIAVASNREKSAVAESMVAVAFSLAAVPIVVAGAGIVALREALAIAGVFASIFVTQTLAVRAIVVASRGAGNPRASRATRAWAFVVTAAAVGAWAVASSRGWWLWTVPLAAAPGLAAALWLVTAPPAPRRLRQVGWTLVATAVWAGVVLSSGFSFWE